MFETRKWRHGRNYSIRDENGNYMHRDGEVISRCAEYWPTRELAQAVLDKYQPKHVWERGDVLLTKYDTVMICVQEIGEPIRVFGLAINNCGAAECNADVVLFSATFLFNVGDKL